MPTDYPSAYDTFTDPTSTDLLDSASVGHASQHTHLNDAMDALQHFVGRMGTTDTATIVGKLLQTTTGLQAHLDDTTAHPAAYIVYTPTTGLSATTAQDAISQVWHLLDDRVSSLESGGSGSGSFTSLSVSGTTSTQNLSVPGTSSLHDVTTTGFLHATGSGYGIQVTNKASVGSDLEVSGVMKALASATVATTLSVAGVSTLASLGVTGAATVGSTLGVTGALTAASVAGAGAVTGASATFAGATSTGALTAPSLTASGNVGAATLSSSGAATVGGALSAASAAISGAATVGTTLGVTGLVTLGAGLSVAAALVATTSVSVGTTLGVTGLATLSGGATIAGTAHIGGVAGAALTVTGSAITANVPFTAGSFSITPVGAQAVALTAPSLVFSDTISSTATSATLSAQSFALTGYLPTINVTGTGSTLGKIDSDLIGTSRVPANTPSRDVQGTTAGQFGLFSQFTDGSNVPINSAGPTLRVVSMTGGGGGTFLSQTAITGGAIAADTSIKRGGVDVASRLKTINAQTGTTYTLVIADAAETIVRIANASAIVLNIPLNSTTAFAIGTQIPVEQGGAGAITFTPAAGVTLNSKSANRRLNAQYSVATLVKEATDTWVLYGDIVA